MKILIVNTLYHPYKVGGAEVSVQLLAEGLVNAGHQVRVVTLHEKNVKKIDSINGVEVSYLPLFNKYWPYSDYVPTKLEKLVWHIVDTYNLVMAKRVEKEILQFQPDIVNTNNLAGFSVAIWDIVKKHNIKLVHTSRDYYLFHPNCTLFKNGKIQSLSSFEVKIWSFIKRKMSRKVDYYIGISKFILDFHMENGFFKDKKTNFIYNPVNKISKSITYEKTKVIGFIGRLSEDKGFDNFCSIAKNNKSEDLKFIAAGKFSNDKDSEILKAQANDANIELLGFVDLQEFINKVDAVVLPIKWNEPFGRVVVECALAGVAVYTNKMGGVTELFNFFNNILEVDKVFDDVDYTIDSSLNLNFSVEEHVNLYNEVYKKVVTDEN